MPKKPCLHTDDIRRVLSGTCPHGTSAEVEEALSSSRSHVFAKDEDIKMCQAEIIRNASAPILVEAALQREQGSFLTDTGALSVRSGAKTGRSPKDKRVVDEPASTDNVWWGPVNIKMTNEAFMINRERAIDYINTRDRVMSSTAMLAMTRHIASQCVSSVCEPITHSS